MSPTTIPWQNPVAPRPDDSVTSWNGFEDQLELAGRERVLRRLSPLHDTLTEAELVERQRAVVAIGIVASTAEEGIRSPCTAAVADFSIVARAAEPPQIVHAADPIESQCLASSP